MHKYAAVTALTITLNITMLALAVSASLTPANAYQKLCGNEGPVGRIECPCARQCEIDARRRGFFDIYHANAGEVKKYQACLSTCVNKADAARR
jgi:hypothetical protein